jgi:putative transcriptional regulator
MLIITIDEVLDKRGRTMYWLAKETDLNYVNLIKLCNNKNTQVSFDVIEKICNALECTPNDIMKINK